MRSEHADELFPGFSDPLVYRFISHDPPASLEALQRDYAELAAGALEGSGQVWLNWVIRELPGRTAVGALQATRYADQSLWIGYQLVRGAWGRGYATEAVGWMLAVLKERFGAVPVHAAVDVRNGASIRVLEKLNFVFLRTEPCQLHGEDSVDAVFCHLPPG